jgi:hypothetical protein
MKKQVCPEKLKTAVKILGHPGASFCCFTLKNQMEFRIAATQGVTQ